MGSSNQFMDKSFKLSVTDGTDTLKVQKSSYSDWVTVEMVTNGSPNGTITIRSEAMAQGLRFLAEQLLKG